MFSACESLSFDFSQAEYRMLGDDIVIWNDLLKAEYLRIMSTLGVNISEQKTFISKYGFSFAKRLFSSYGELSPISYRL